MVQPHPSNAKWGLSSARQGEGSARQGEGITIGDEATETGRSHNASSVEDTIDQTMEVLSPKRSPIHSKHLKEEQILRSIPKYKNLGREELCKVLGSSSSLRTLYLQPTWKEHSSAVAYAWWKALDDFCGSLLRSDIAVEELVHQMKWTNNDLSSKVCYC
jgi:hypothetical protein